MKVVPKGHRVSKGLKAKVEPKDFKASEGGKVSKGSKVFKVFAELQV